jgi:enoyl-CoA hydratase/carnithine racemase
VDVAPALFEKHGAVAVVTLNRPSVLNAYNLAMRDALDEIFTAVRDDPEVRVMVLQGNGRAFCTGGDVSEFGSAPSPTAARAARWHRDVWGVLQSLPALTLAAVHGFVVGSGFEMAMLCDVCIASSDARFALPETGLAMIPGVGGTQTAPRLLGLGRAMDLVLTGRRIDAAAARKLGVVAAVVAGAQLRPAAMRRARQLARLSPAVVRALKRAVNDGFELPLADGCALERRLARQAGLSAVMEHA